ncbi:hypothetical protein KC727_02645 [Candidatus Kaiserbacteria bacterium]|nr:hypothetical protein [Candidatus Kaiserbacteria bacterium]
MGLFGFGGRSSDAQYGALFDVGSGSVGVAIVRSDHTKPQPEVIYAERISTRATLMADRDEIVRGMREALFTASLNLAKTGIHELRSKDSRGTISKLLVTGSAPWSYTISKNILSTHDTEVKVTKALLDDLVENAETEMTDDLEEDTISNALGLTIVERATIDVRINGYSVREPVGLRGKNISLSHITGLLQKEVLDALDEVEEKIFPNTSLSAHSFMLVNYCVLRDAFSEVDNVTIIDVTTEATEIGVVQDGVLNYSTHARHGLNTLLRSIVATTNTAREDALSLLRGYVENTITDKERTRIEHYITQYAHEIAKTLKKIQQKEPVQTTLAITAPFESLAFYRTILPAIVSDATGIEVSLLPFDILGKGGIDHIPAQDIYLAIIARFFHKLHGCGELNSA